MRNRFAGVAGIVALAALAGSRSAASAQSADIASRRQVTVNNILTTLPGRDVAAQRLTCMFGKEPANVIKARKAGKDAVPDAADTCVAVLIRTAHDGHLLDLYRELLTNLGGNLAKYDKLPLAIGNAVLDGDGKIDMGNGNKVVPPTLAFDAGFTVAYLKGDARPEELDPAKLKSLAESCLAIEKSADTCFGGGYYYGAQAFRAHHAASH